MVEKSNEASIFNAARKIESAGERRDFLDAACGDDTDLRSRVEILLAAFLEESQFLEQPAQGLAPTIAPENAREDLAISMNAGFAATFGDESAVVFGNTNHSVLKSLGATLNQVPRVSLREPVEEGDEPVQRSSSPEIPNQPSGSRYQLHGEIARGGMGAVLHGRDTDLGRDLAVKVLLDTHKDKPEVVQRFVEEAQIGGQLQHPGIAPVYELGQFADQRPFFSMKLVKGDTLSKLLSNRDDPAAERSKLIGIFEQVCQTMAYAHSRGVIHRDLKPANIMVGAFGEVQVMDWGLAKVLSDGGAADEKTARRKQNGETMIQTMRSVGSDAPGTVGSVGSKTQMGSVMGTPAYMPPEQALGEIDVLDQRADVFGLGAILAEILTGRPPYVADDSTQIYRMASRGKLGDCFTRLDECGADSELVSLAKRCLELEPAHRPKDANALAEQVTGYLESVETKLRESEIERAGEAARVVEQRKRFRVTLRLGVAALAILIVGIATTAWQAWKANQQTLVARAARKDAIDQRDNARTAQQNAVKEKNAADVARAAAVDAQREAEDAERNKEAIARQRRRELYAANMQLADQLYQGQNGEQLRIQQLLAAWIPLDDQEEDLREFSWRYQWTRLYRSASVTAADCKGVAITPAGKVIVTDSNGLHEVDENGKKSELIRWTLDDPWSYMSSDGRWVAARFATGIKLYHVESRKMILSLPQNRCSFSSNGKYLAAWKQGVEVESLPPGEDAIPVWKIEKNGVAKPIEPLVIGEIKRLPYGENQLKMGNDGTSFLLRSSPGLIESREVGAFMNGNPEPVKWSHRGSANNCAWSPDGRIIASSGMTGTIELRFSFELSEKITISTHGKTISTIRFSLDGKTLATGGGDGTIDLWDVSALAATAKRFEALTEDASREIESQQQSILSVSAPRLIRTIKGHVYQVSNIDAALNFSPDGTQLISLDLPVPGMARLWNLKTLPDTFETDQIAKDLHSGQIPLQTLSDWRNLRIGKTLPEDLIEGKVATGERIVAIFDPEKESWNVLDEAETWDDFAFLLDGSPGSTIRLKLQNSNAEQHEVTLRRRRSNDPRSFSVAFAPDGNDAAVADNVLGATRLRLESGEAKRFPEKGTSVAYSPNGRLLAIASMFAISIRDAETDKELYRLDSLVDEERLPSNGMGGDLAFSPDGKYLAHVSGDRYNSSRSDLNVWRTSDFQKIGNGPLDKEDFGMQSVIFSPDSSLLLVGDNLGRVQIWETFNWKSRGAIRTRQRGIGALAFSPDGKHLVVGSWKGTGCVSVWDIGTRKELKRLSSQPVGHLTLSPDGRTLAVGSFDHNVVLWDMKTGKRLQTIQSHADSVFGVAFSKDGNRLATMGSESVLRLWDAASIKEIERHPNTLTALARLGTWRVEQERYQEAEVVFSKVVELFHETKHFRENRLPTMRRNLRIALDFGARLKERRGRWDEALDSRAAIMELEPNNHAHYVQVASAHLYQQKSGEFWEVWHEMFARWGETRDPRLAEPIARLRLLVDAPDHELQATLKTADWVFSKRISQTARFDAMLKGMAEYRRGRFSSALGVFAVRHNSF